MKKNIFFLTIILALSLFILPNNVFAEINVTNYKEVIDEEIKTFGNEKDYKEYIDVLQKANLSDYQESQDKVNVYIFRGSTCVYCLKAITYFASKADEYKNYINLKTYEVWGNQDNNNLMSNVGNVLGKEISGVPFIVIGNKSFDGYSEDMNEEIDQTIKNEFNKEKKYDVMDHLDEKKSTSKYNNKKIFAILGVIFVGIILIIIIFRYVNIRNQKLELQRKKRLEEAKKIEDKVKEGKKKTTTKNSSKNNAKKESMKTNSKSNIKTKSSKVTQSKNNTIRKNTKK